MPVLVLEEINVLSELRIFVVGFILCFVSNILEAVVFLQSVYMGMGCAWTAGASLSRRLPCTNSC
jgi:hypothetical protein